MQTTATAGPGGSLCGGTEREGLWWEGSAGEMVLRGPDDVIRSSDNSSIEHMGLCPLQGIGRCFLELP